MATKNQKKNTVSVKEKGSTGGTKKPAASGRGKSQTNTVDDRTTKVLIGLIFVVLGIFLFAAVQFHAAGEFGNRIGEYLKGTMGLIGLLFPFYLILFGSLMIADKTVHFSTWAFALGFIILLMLCVVNSGRFIDPLNLKFDARDFFAKGIELKSGGLFGMGFAMFLVKYIGKVGLYCVSLGIIVLCVFLLLKNTPIKNLINKLRIYFQEKTEKNLIKKEEREKRIAEQLKQEEQIRENQARIKENREALKRRRLENKERNAGLVNIDEDLDRISLFPSSEENRKPKSTFQVIADGPSSESSISISGYGLEPSAPAESGLGLQENQEQSQVENTSPVKSSLSIEKDRKINTPKESESESKTEKPSTKKSETKQTKDNKPQTLEADEFIKHKRKGRYKKPTIDLLDIVENNTNPLQVNNELREKAKLLEDTLKSFNVDAKVVEVTQGPAVTRYEIQPSVGVKVNKIVGLSNDIALNLRAKSIRIEAPIPGKPVVGIEVENDNVNMVSIRDILSSREFKEAKSKISFGVGRDIAGKAIIADLKTMPHLLIAGATGSGKSVCINGIITSILYKADPEEVKLVLIDPKVVELGEYNGIPHLLIPVVTDPNKAAAALNWAVAEMTNRYKLFADNHVRDLEGYNEFVERENKKIQEQKEDYDSRSDGVIPAKLVKLPQIVIIIDELADLMMAAPSQVEEAICRIAQLARAAGMHLIVATQRPSVDVITGVIKANIPSRIAFAVASQFDSRTILDMSGAEKLVGKGDMLYSPIGVGSPIRVQGCYIDDDEIHRVIDFVKSQVDAEYNVEVIDRINSGNVGSSSESSKDDLFDEAVEFVITAGKASTSLIQRRFRIGYNRAANIIDDMEREGIIGPAVGSKPREILMTLEEYKRGKSFDPDQEEEPEEVFDAPYEEVVEADDVQQEETPENISEDIPAPRESSSYSESDIRDLFDKLDNMD